MKKLSIYKKYCQHKIINLLAKRQNYTIELARAVGKDTAYVARTVRLTLLAPEIIHAILHGTLKKSISMETLRKSWPENWEEQKKYFGLE